MNSELFEEFYQSCCKTFPPAFCLPSTDPESTIKVGSASMKKFLFLFLALFVSVASIAAQNVAPVPAAAETIQQSQSASAGASQVLAPESVEPPNPKQAGQPI